MQLLLPDAHQVCHRIRSPLAELQPQLKSYFSQSMFPGIFTTDLLSHDVLLKPYTPTCSQNSAFCRCLLQGPLIATHFTSPPVHCFKIFLPTIILPIIFPTLPLPCSTLELCGYTYVCMYKHTLFSQNFSLSCS